VGPVTISDLRYYTQGVKVEGAVQAHSRFAVTAVTGMAYTAKDRHDAWHQVQQTLGGPTLCTAQNSADSSSRSRLSYDTEVVGLH
jgi:hypothetical protein